MDVSNGYRDRLCASSRKYITLNMETEINDKYENVPLASDMYAHERQDEGEPTPEELQERFIREDPECDIVGGRYKPQTVEERLKAECERDVKFAIAQQKMMQPLYDLLAPKIK